MTGFVLVVELDVQPEHVEKFKALIVANARTSVENEPGCLQFDVLQHSEAPEKFVLYEVYENEDAYNHHMTLTHTQTFLSQSKELLTRVDFERFHRAVSFAKVDDR